eukprot:TRINITY_DN2034_c0_g2_i1.p1 TRINITY_DN2034_c0_g2~~TRINITY_DN2034_c0_g2_i1.p1  ORF type:complete len:888 (+),score=157.62 TRINITY_DN2034_c0_g2_i1:125-2665(+)
MLPTTSTEADRSSAQPSGSPYRGYPSAPTDSSPSPSPSPSFGAFPSSPSAASTIHVHVDSGPTSTNDSPATTRTLPHSLAVTALSQGPHQEAHNAAAAASYIRFSAQVVPEQRHQNKKLSLPLGFLLTPIAPSDAPSAEDTNGSTHEYLRRSPVSCPSCGACVGSYTYVDMRSGEWQCLFCGSHATSAHFAAAPLPPSAFQGDATAPSPATPQPLGAEQHQMLRAHYPELQFEVVDYIDPTKQPSVVRNHLSGRVVFLVDCTLPLPALQNVCGGIEDAVKTLSEFTCVGLVSVSNVVSFFELGLSENTATSCQVFSGSRLGTLDEMRTFALHQSRFLVPLKHCRGSLSKALAYLLSRAPPALKGRRAVATPQLRAFGTAVDYSLHLMNDGDSQSASGGHVVSFLHGAPSFGPGAVQIDSSGADELVIEQANAFYRERASIAQKAGICMDIFCIGARQFAVKTLNCLVLANAGILLLLREYEDSQLGPNLCTGLHRRVGVDGEFDIRSSPAVTITHVIGPATPSKSAYDNCHTCLMSGVQHRFTFAIYFDISEDVVDDYVHFQICSSFTNLRNERIMRVINARLPAKKKNAFIDSVNADVTSVLMAKKLVLDARKIDPEDIIQVHDDLDHKVQSIVQKCKTANTAELWDGFGGGLPRSLSMIPYMMYLLRRGSLLGPILQHQDDIDPVRCLFLQRDLFTCHRLIRPILYLATESSFVEVPLQTLALHSSSVLLMDHVTDIFVWRGRDTTEQQHGHLVAKALDYARVLAEGRFPQPYVMSFKEGESMERWLRCRLIPSHKDEPEQQMQAFPLLRELGEADRRQLLAKFHHTDDMSYAQFWEQIVEAIN